MVDSWTREQERDTHAGDAEERGGEILRDILAVEVLGGKDIVSLYPEQRGMEALNHLLSGPRRHPEGGQVCRPLWKYSTVCAAVFTALQWWSGVIWSERRSS